MQIRTPKNVKVTLFITTLLLLLFSTYSAIMMKKNQMIKLSIACRRLTAMSIRVAYMQQPRCIFTGERAVYKSAVIIYPQMEHITL